MEDRPEVEILVGGPTFQPSKVQHRCNSPWGIRGFTREEFGWQVDVFALWEGI